MDIAFPLWQALLLAIAFALMGGIVGYFVGTREFRLSRLPEQKGRGG